jgi:hypothetical protein
MKVVAASQIDYIGIYRATSVPSARFETRRLARGQSAKNRGKKSIITFDLYNFESPLFKGWGLALQ